MHVMSGDDWLHCKRWLGSGSTWGGIFSSSPLILDCWSLCLSIVWMLHAYKACRLVWHSTFQFQHIMDEPTTDGIWAKKLWLLQAVMLAGMVLCKAMGRYLFVCLLAQLCHLVLPWLYFFADRHDCLQSEKVPGPVHFTSLRPSRVHDLEIGPLFARSALAPGLASATELGSYWHGTGMVKATFMAMFWNGLIPLPTTYLLSCLKEVRIFTLSGKIFDMRYT